MLFFYQKHPLLQSYVPYPDRSTYSQHQTTLLVAHSYPEISTKHIKPVTFNLHREKLCHSLHFPCFPRMTHSATSIVSNSTNTQPYINIFTDKCSPWNSLSNDIACISPELNITLTPTQFPQNLSPTYRSAACHDAPVKITPLNTFSQSILSIKYLLPHHKRDK